jgi:hypothetical protein
MFSAEPPPCEYFVAMDRAWQNKTHEHVSFFLAMDRALQKKAHEA